MKILVGTPTYNGQLTTQYTRSLLELWTEIGAEADWRTTKATLIAWARNVFASHVLEEDYTHLLFVDADIDFPARVVKRMLAFDQPVVSAVYPHRTLDLQAFYAQARRQPDAGSAMAAALSYPFELAQPHEARGDFHKAVMAPAGLMLIQRQALAKMREAYPELYRPAAGSYYEFQGLKNVLQCFEALIDDNGIAMSEDVSFCRRWRAIGGELWVTFDQAVGHTGPFTFRATG
ncbi:hypothetical protein [Phenylobacterium sp.]|uniref:hypothetical protein n=1 Tax=Phenylobacterium sp. TaxID=1871053 RepID=UPI0025F18E8D|nr:hypothetical protein [Phenylobacterium sp.]